MGESRDLLPKDIKDVFYVGMQLLLFLIYILWDQPIWELQLSPVFYYFSWPLLIFAVVLFVYALWNVRHSLSPYPSPKEHAKLKTHGAFSFSRHPIYSSIIIGLSAWSVLQENINQMIISFLLLIFFYIKARYEEKLLKRKFPEYLSYQEQTGMLFPKSLRFRL